MSAQSAANEVQHVLASPTEEAPLDDTPTPVGIPQGAQPASMIERGATFEAELTALPDGDDVQGGRGCVESMGLQSCVVVVYP